MINKSTRTLRLKSPLENSRRTPSINRDFSRNVRSMKLITKKIEIDRVKETIHPVKNRCALILDDISGLYSNLGIDINHEDIYTKIEKKNAIVDYQFFRKKINRLIYLKKFGKSSKLFN